MAKKEYSLNDELKNLHPPGYVLESGKPGKPANIVYYEMVITKEKGENGAPVEVVSEKKHSRPEPETVSPASLDLLIGTYIYQYVDKPSALCIHSKELLAALLELKKRREAEKAEAAA